MSIFLLPFLSLSRFLPLIPQTHHAHNGHLVNLTINFHPSYVMEYWPRLFRGLTIAFFPRHNHWRQVYIAASFLGLLTPRWQHFLDFPHPPPSSANRRQAHEFSRYVRRNWRRFTNLISPLFMAVFHV